VSTQETKVETKRPGNVFESIERMTEILAKAGIAKDKGGTKEINYKFRGIDDIRNNTSPLMKECALVILPKMVAREEKERVTKSGGFAMWVVLKVEFDFINTVNSSNVVIPVIAEAVDYSDKATQKAMSQAYKTLAINTFNIPTEGEQDTDGEKMEFKGKKVGVFDNAELREMYVDNCIKTFTDAESQLRLKDAEGFYHETLILMSHSEDEADKKAANRIRGVYAERFKALAPMKLAKTVSEAMSHG